MKKGPFSTFSTFSAGVFLLYRPRLFRKSATMRTRSQTRKAQEQASSSASLGDHFDTPHPGFGVAADVQPSRAHERDSVSSFGSLDLPLHTKSASSSCVLPPVPVECPTAWGHSVVSSAGLAAAFDRRAIAPESNGYSRSNSFFSGHAIAQRECITSIMSPLVLEGVQGVPRPERPLPFPRRHLIDPRIKRKLDKVLARMERSKRVRPLLHLQLRWPFCPGLMPSFMSRTRLTLFVVVRQLGLPLDLRATTLGNRLKVLFLRSSRTPRCLPPGRLTRQRITLLSIVLLPSFRQMRFERLKDMPIWKTILVPIWEN